MGEIIRQEKKQKRKEEDKVCTLHSDFVTVQQDSGMFGEKSFFLISSYQLNFFFFPKIEGHNIKSCKAVTASVRFIQLT